MKNNIFLFLILLTSFSLGFINGFIINKLPPEKTITEYYTLNKYHKAGTTEFIYVIEFKFNTHQEACIFAGKIEKYRKM